MFTNLNSKNAFIDDGQRNGATTMGIIRAENLCTIFIIIFAFFSLGLQAQACDTLVKHFPGAVVLRAEKKKEVPGATRHGCIKLMNWQEMYVAPKLVDSLGQTNRYFGRDALAYWYLRNKDTIYYLNAGPTLSRYKWIYLQRLVNGPMELYSFKTQGTTNLITFTKVEYTYYYLRKDGRWLNKKAIVWNEGGKRKQLNQIFSDCKPAIALINKTSGLDLDEILRQLVTLYNTSCH